MHSRILEKVIGWPPPRLDPTRETAWLDGLRGIAASLVMAYHYHTTIIGFYLEAPFGSTLIFPNTTVHEFWRLPFFRFFISSGHAQVSIFFVLSGLVLSWKPLDYVRSGQSERLLTALSSSVVRRWFRLYLPCFAVALIVFARVRYNSSVPPGITVYPDIFRQLWDYILACEAFARPLMREREHPNWLHKYSWIMWTIPLEFEGSLMVFVSLLAMARIKSYVKRICIIGFLSIYASLLGYWTYWLFLSGVLIADYIKEAGGFHQLLQQSSPSLKPLWWLMLATGIWMAGVPQSMPKFYDRPGYGFLDSITPSSYDDIESGVRFWWCLAGILILFSSCHLRRIQIICESPIARYLGRLSYMLYLTHNDFPKSLGSIFIDWFSRSFGTPIYDETFKKEMYGFTSLSGTILFCLSWLACGIPAIILAHWCEVLIDRPSVAFAKWIETQLISDGTAPSRERVEDLRILEPEDAIPLPVYRNVND